MEFSLEKISERIHFGKTKEYFAEVLSSYQNENYRSSIVMLWSVAVCDIVYKLQHLVDLYEDASASVILTELTALQNSDPKSSAWEIKLVDDVYGKTNLIDGAEYENLRYLQKQRHLSAHPVLNNESELHTPNKETVRALLRNTLEGLLIKPPFYTQKIFDELIADVSDNTEALNTAKKVKRYVESRYLNRLTSDVELQIYRSLWKFVFKLENEDCGKNRKINLQVLDVIGQRNIGRLRQFIDGEKDYYSNIAGNGSPVAYLVFYLSQNHDLYGALSEDARLKVQHCIESDSAGKTLGWFVKGSLSKHFEDLIEWIESEEYPVFKEGQWDALLQINDSEEWQEMFCKAVGAYYAVSKSFDEADSRFRDALQSRIHLFSLVAINYLLGKIEANTQVYRRGLASIDHPKLIKRALELDENFDFSPYPYFEKIVEEGEVVDG
ncbi:hypothetical protein [Zhongshania borealis]|uniref:Uncharacterized protein n=1 Tax=Zhongshania borealis TaxID=889488 RepID=A0ABP7X735_9GAMM